MQIQASAMLSFNGILKQLQEKHSKPCSLQTFIRPLLESHPTSNLLVGFEKYLPLPQPISTKIEAVSRELTNF